MLKTENTIATFESNALANAVMDAMVNPVITEHIAPKGKAKPKAAYLPADFNDKAVHLVFTDADNMSLNFAERLFALGIADKKTAKPFAMHWAAKKYDAKIEIGQRGEKLPRDSAAEKAFYRVLKLCFPDVDTKETKAVTIKPTKTALEKALAAFAKLSDDEKEQFFNSIESATSDNADNAMIDADIDSEI
jgi:hypothetical protein